MDQWIINDGNTRAQIHYIYNSIVNDATTRAINYNVQFYAPKANAQVNVLEQPLLHTV